MRELESLALARLRRLIEDDSVPASVQLRAALAILNRPKEPSGREDWNVPRMESLDATLNRKPLLAEPPALDTTRQTSTLFAVSDAVAAGASTDSQSLRARMAVSRPPKNSARKSGGRAASAGSDSTAGER
jgi:hypothetical protein